MSQIEIENVILMSITTMFFGFSFFIFVPRCTRVDANLEQNFILCNFSFCGNAKKASYTASSPFCFNTSHQHMFSFEKKKKKRKLNAKQ